MRLHGLPQVMEDIEFERDRSESLRAVKGVLVGTALGLIAWIVVATAVGLLRLLAG